MPTDVEGANKKASPATSAYRWSARLLVAVGLVLALGLSLRITGFTTLPVDPPLGAEATNAAFVNVLAGHVEGGLGRARFFPPPAPWYGPAPVDPASSLPLFGWAVAALSFLLGEGAWIGRLVATLFSALAGLALFSVVRLAAGARAALYALLFYSVVPVSVVLGQQYSPASLSLLAQALAVWALCRWRLTVAPARLQGSGRVFMFAIACAAFAALIDPGSVFLAIPAAYLLVLTGRESDHMPENVTRLSLRSAPRSSTLKEIWQSSAYRGKTIGYAAMLLGAVAIWRIAMSGAEGGLVLGTGDGGGGAGAALGALFQGGTYVEIIGMSMAKLLPILAAPLLVAGLLLGARRPWQLLFHAWSVAALVHILFDAGRVAKHDDILLPLILPVCGLVGIGAAWAGSLPARIWLAVTEQKRENDAEYAVSPHTSWLLDLPEEKMPGTVPARPQAQIAFGKSVAQRAQQAGTRARRTWFMSIGNLVVLAGFGFMALASWNTVQARLQPSVDGIELAQAGREVAAATTPGSRLIVIGSLAPEMFYAARRTGWAISEDNFGMARIQELQREGAAYLLSTDQEWLGHQPDYTALLTSYSVAKLGRNYILFDLGKKPEANDRLYFLESGHTLGGEFRTFWESHGGVAKLGYPISEEIEQQDPLDGETRRVQYFERAVLEYHSESAGTPNAVMLAAVGRWATLGKTFPKVPAFASTSDRVYFPESGHSLKQEFLKYWQSQGGVAAFGYPISEEMPEISAADGKVYTVQYFERARFEWHPTEAGTSSAVQLGLIGKQVWEARK